MIPGKSLSFTESQGAPSISVHGSELWDVYSGALTFFRATNSFSAVALRATSSSYLGVRETEAGAEESGFGSHPGQALLGVKWG